MTDQEPTQEELQKFWEWCSFHNSWSDGSGSMKTYYPDGSPLEVDQSGNSIYPALTLDNLFKYAVPKLYHVNIEYHPSVMVRTKVDVWDINKEKSTCIKDDIVLALFRAIQEAVK